MAKTLTLFTRESCSLCHTMHALLDRVREAHPFQLVVIDLDREATPEQHAAYDWEVPVLEIDGRKVAKYRIEEERLLRLLTS